MRTIECEDLETLVTALAELPPGALLRGQKREYLRRDGGPDLRSSIDRHGCQPNRMLKWWHYSRSILSAYVKAFDGRTDLAVDQAILQHYGWRSFFLDATTDPAVACWFAANSYRTEACGELIEDCWRDPFFVRRTRALYEPAEGEGCLYVIDRKALRAKGINAVDLVEIATEEGRHRCSAQSAFMIGPLSGNLPDNCASVIIRAPNAVFGAYAAHFELTTERLFPGPKTDPVMAALLSIPWTKLELEDDELGIDFFDRGLPLPEYEVEHLRRLGPSSAMYRRFWLADSVKPGTRFGDTTFFLTQETLFHGGTSGAMTFPRLASLLREKISVAVEIDGLVRHPYGGPGSFYSKGIYLEEQSDGAILLTELQTQHLGARPAGFGITRGAYFTVSDSGVWCKTEHPEQCRCGNELHHSQHLVVAEHFEHALSLGDPITVRDKVFCLPGVDPKTDPQALEWLELEDGDPGMLGE
ncbi:FRG domain-containing protein [Brevundimonas bullata]|uniref:FRG domain-containing protein n=1 Tax=Brevundimonas bullata TaxID=13160 RepID=UPI000E0C0CAB|nr:FRG domain-containing protein [Brevundimonas bullata]WQE37321.1 FRG domain-containing protein [Brevundimonas bullata]